MNTIGERLRDERAQLGMTQEKFASAAGVLRGAQVKYEKDERRPDADYLAAIAAIGADVQYIVTGVRSDASLTPDERQLIALFRAAPLTGKMAAVGALQGAMGNVAGSKISVGGSFNGQVIHDVEGDVVNHGPVVIGSKRKKERK